MTNNTLLIHRCIYKPYYIEILEYITILLHFTVRYATLRSFAPLYATLLFLGTPVHEFRVASHPFFMPFPVELKVGLMTHMIVYFHIATY